MRVFLAPTREYQEPGEIQCSFCKERFPLGEATLWAVSESNILLGEVCPACVSAGAGYIQEILDRRAYFSHAIADEAEGIALEEVMDLPSVDALLVAESFYGAAVDDV